MLASERSSPRMSDVAARAGVSLAAAADRVAVFELVPADDDPQQMRRPGPSGR